MKIAYTRLADKTTENLARELGLELVQCPLISTILEPIGSNTVAQFSAYRYDAWIVTSKNAARFVKKLALYDGVQLPETLYAVGSSSAAIVHGSFPTIVVSDIANAQNLAQKINARHQTGSFCFFRGNLALDTLPKHLSPAFTVALFECYTTKLLQKTIPENEYDAIAFFSPSAVDAFAASNKRAQKPIFAIGQTTATAITRHFGIEPIVADRPNAESLLKTVKNYYDERNQ